MYTNGFLGRLAERVDIALEYTEQYPWLIILPCGIALGVLIAVVL